MINRRGEFDVRKLDASEGARQKEVHVNVRK
jgi:hypothetical protein